MVRDVFRLARENSPSVVFIDEIDAIATKRFDAQTGADREVQRILLELLNQMDGFDQSTNVKVQQYIGAVRSHHNSWRSSLSASIAVGNKFLVSHYVLTLIFRYGTASFECRVSHRVVSCRAAMRASGDHGDQPSGYSRPRAVATWSFGPQD